MSFLVGSWSRVQSYGVLDHLRYKESKFAIILTTSSQEQGILSSQELIIIKTNPQTQLLELGLPQLPYSNTGGRSALTG